MFNPQQFYIQQNNNFEFNQFSCNQHKQPYTYIDLSLMCEREYRMKCPNCQLDQNCIPIDVFGNLCENIYQNIDQNNFQVARTVLLKFQKEIEEIQGLLQQLNNKLIKISSTQKPTNNCLELLSSFVNCKKKQSNEKLDFSIQKQQDQILIKFGIKELQELAEVLSKNTILNQQNHNYTLKFKDIDDQQLAESNQYFEFTQNLKYRNRKFEFYLQYIINQKHRLQNDENDIKNVENIQIQQVNQLNGQIVQQQQKYTNTQRIFEIQKSQNMLLKENQSIADIQLNYDQSLLCIRFTEPNNYLSIWKYDPEKKKWNFSTQLQCYIHSLIDFKLSKLENAFVTCGEDSKQIYAPYKPSQNNSSIKIWKQEGYTWIEKQIYKPVVQSGHGFSRITQVLFSKSEKCIYYAEGNRLVLLELQGEKYVFKYQEQKSSEIITNLQISNDGRIIAVGAFDQKISLWKIEDAKLILIQQLRLQNNPKRILFSQNDQDLLICTKDGLVHCFNKQKQREYKEYQKIFNIKGKIRAIEFNNDSSVLAIGGETNALQIWQKNQDDQWIFVDEAVQDNFIEAISFANNPDVIYSSNNNELYIHHII